jgi:hypothetical protein
MDLGNSQETSLVTIQQDSDKVEKQTGIVKPVEEVTPFSACIRARSDSDKVMLCKQLIHEYDHHCDSERDDRKMFDFELQHKVARNFLLRIGEVVFDRGGVKRRCGRPRKVAEAVNE